MGRSTLVALLLISAGVLLPLVQIPAIPLPAPAPESRDADIWRGILEGMADYIEADGKTDAPVFTTTSDILQYRDAVLAAPIRAISGGDNVASIIGPKLSAITAWELDAETRSKVVEAFRQSATEVK